MGIDLTTKSPPPLARTADAVVMVRPRNFGFNEETGADNEFQARPAAPAAAVNRWANREFEDLVDRLRAAGVEVMILEPDLADPRKLPDAVFPNNWFSTEHDGTILLYPMKTPNRRAEQRSGDLGGPFSAAAAVKSERSSGLAAPTRAGSFWREPVRW